MQPTNQKFSFKSLFIPLTAKKAIICISIIGFLVFFNSLFNGFVWDDIVFIVNNSEIHTINFAKIFGPSIFNNGTYYRPFTAWLFSIIYLFFQQNAFYYHLFQLSIHIFVVALLFIVLTYFFNRVLSLFLSLIFLVHPMNVESASYIAGNVGPLFSLFGLLSLLLVQKTKLTKKIYFFITLLLFLALLTKEEGVLYVIVVALFSFLFLKKHFKYIFLCSLSASAAYLLCRITIGKELLTFTLQSNTPSEVIFVPIAHLSFYQKLINIPAIFFYYIKTFLFPSKLAIEQFWTISSINFSGFYLPLLLDSFFFLCIFGIALYLWKYNKALFKVFCFFFIWFLIGVGLHLPFSPLDMTVSDRWFYFPMIGLLGMIGVGIQLLIKKPLVKPFLLPFAISILIIFSLRTMLRNTNYYDETTLLSHDTQVEGNYELESSLGAEYMQEGNIPQSIMHLQKSVNLYPYGINLYDLGVAYESTGNLQKAEEYYSKAFNSTNSITNHQHIVDIYFRLALAQIRLNKPDAAKQTSLIGLRYYPNSADLQYTLVTSEYKMSSKNDVQQATK